MRYARIVVFMLGVGAMSAAVLQPVRAPQGQVTLEQIEGTGLLDVLACGSCLGSASWAMLNGWSSLWIAAMRARDGALGSACVAACVRAF